MSKDNIRKVYIGEYASHFTGHAAKEYLESYSPESVNSKLHIIQSDLVRNILKKYSNESKPDHIDFACGFGLWLSALSDLTNSKIGIDINESMLDLIPKDLNVTKINSKTDQIELSNLLNSEMRLITSFRFLLNSSPQGSTELLKLMSNYLRHPSRDVAIVNVHGSNPSIRSFSKNVRKGGKQMSRKQLKKFFEGNGFSIIEVQEMQLFPYGLLKKYPLLFLFESFFARVKYVGFGIDKVYVLQRNQ